MPTPLIPQEVYLLERYCSLDYFRPMRDQWETMVAHVERCLDVFMDSLPPDYRSRPRPYQPDIVWGERVLPNFRSTQQNLYRAYINLTHGDLSALAASNGVTGGLRAINADYSADWMGESQVTAVIPNALPTFWELIRAPQGRADNIGRTASRIWTPGALSNRYDSETRGPLDPPASWPRYRLDPSVRAEPGGLVARSGIYLPDIDNSCAALLVEGKSTSRAQHLVRMEDVLDESGQSYAQIPVTEWRSTGWTLIERVPGEFIPTEQGLGTAESEPTRIPGGEACSRSGWWHTPAQAGSRRYFRQGEVLPKVEGSDYGDTFWLWSQDQSNPKL